MKRPVFIITLAMINGIIIGKYIHLSIITVSCLIIVVTILIFKLKYKTVILIYVIVVMISSIYMNYKNMDYNNKYKKYDGQTIKIVGTVISKVQEKEYKKIYTLKVDSINGQKKYKDDYVLINMKKDERNIKYADKISIVGEYEEPSTARNYKGFDYKDYLKTEKTYGIVKEKNNSIRILKNGNVNFINLINNYFIEKFSNNLEKILPEKTEALEEGILLGYTDRVDEQIQNDFKDSNLTHMLAVSRCEYCICNINI